MKHQYESEILFRLMERDGFNIPSSVPPYESEIKAYLINQVKLAYPKLTDYEAEWLLYNYTKHLPAEFPISSATNVTKATFENVVPFAYQSAILKGQTMVNLVGSMYRTGGSGKFTIEDTGYSHKVSMTGEGSRVLMYKLNQPLVNGKKYFIYVPNKKSLADHKSKISCGFYDGGTNYSVDGIELTKDYVIFTPTAAETYVSLTEGVHSNMSIGDTYEVNYPVLMEYQEGMENWVIPYFEGMQSVKVPVLTTNNSNLVMPSDFERGYIEESTGQNIPNDYQEFCRTIGFIGVKGFVGRIYGGAKYNGTTRSVRLFGYDKDKNLIKTSVNSIEVTSEIIYIRANIHTPENPSDPTKLQDIYISSKNSYEPYKSNILTVNEDVTLRGIGDVKDELNLLTGELTQRIGEIVLDGSDDENWVKRNNGDGTNTITFQIPLEANKHNEIILDKFALNQASSDGIEGFGYASDIKALYIEIKRNRLNNVNVDEFKQWLSQNPITVQYTLTTESVKTVDLKTVNESGESVHFMPLEGTMNVISSGEPIQPTFDMSVPVEASTQNLASFIDLEMEE